MRPGMTGGCFQTWTLTGLSTPSPPDGEVKAGEGGDPAR